MRFAVGASYGMEPWKGDIWILAAVNVRGQGEGSKVGHEELKDLGFLTEGDSAAVLEVEGEAGTVGGDTGETSFEGRAASEVSAEEWTVDFPCQLVGPEWLQGIVRLHEAVSHHCRILSYELASWSLEKGELRRVALELGSALREREWCEVLLVSFQPVEEVGATLRALKSEVPLHEGEPPAVEQFLQTRTVSLEEARGELERWKAPAEDELEALEKTTGAVESDYRSGG